MATKSDNVPAIVQLRALADEMKSKPWAFPWRKKLMDAIAALEGEREMDMKIGGMD